MFLKGVHFNFLQAATICKPNLNIHRQKENVMATLWEAISSANPT
jgi:hypothetical protein